MIEVLIIIALLVVIVGFMIYDHRTGKAQLPRTQMAKGFTPGESLRWSVPALLSVVCALFGLLVLTGEEGQGSTSNARPRLVQVVLESILGEGAIGYVALTIAIVLSGFAFRRWRQRSVRH